MSENLCPIEAFSLTHGMNPQYCFRETKDGKVALRMEVDYVGHRESNANWTAIKPGDRIVIKALIKAAPSDSPDAADPYKYSGGRIGLDFYGETNLGDGLPSGGGEFYVFPMTPIGQQPIWNVLNCVGKNVSTVQHGLPEWVMQEYDFIVPDKVYVKTRYGTTIPPQQISGCIPWLDSRPISDAASVWFAETEFYVNPTVALPPPNGPVIPALGPLIAVALIYEAAKNRRGG